MRRCINYVFAIFCKKSAGCTAFAAANGGSSKWFSGTFRNFTNKHLVAFYAVFRIGALEDQPFAISAKICFRIVATKRKLLQISKMFFFGVLECIGIKNFEQYFFFAKRSQ